MIRRPLRRSGWPRGHPQAAANPAVPSAGGAATTSYLSPPPSRATGAEDARQATSKGRNLGVEEEFHLVDLGTRRLAPRAAELLERLNEPSYVAELQQCVVEINSDVTSNLTDLRSELVRRRAVLVDAAGELGLGVVAAGTVPLASAAELTVTPTPRYDRMLSDYQLLAREQLICGTQVHVEVPDRDEAVAVADRISGDLPTLLALSASSPYWVDGTDTGYASVRTLVWSRWPTTGLSSGSGGAAMFDAMVEDLIAGGVITDPGMLYFDVRPARRVPTLELRICDSCPSIDTIILVAGLYRALVDRGIAEHREGLPARAFPHALGRAASWRAARSGLEGDLFDLTARTARPAAVVVRALVAELEPQLCRNGDWATVAALTDDLLQAGTSAARQRWAHERRGRLTDVVDELLAETARAAPTSTGPAASPARLWRGGPPAGRFADRVRAQSWAPDPADSTS